MFPLGAIMTAAFKIYVSNVLGLLFVEGSPVALGTSTGYIAIAKLLNETVCRIYRLKSMH